MSVAIEFKTSFIANPNNPSNAFSSISKGNNASKKKYAKELPVS